MAKADPFRFSTKYQDDETDLLYYGYRYEKDGRWLSRDPLAEKDGWSLPPGNALFSSLRNATLLITGLPNGLVQDPGLNLYLACKNDPVLFYDLLGLAACTSVEINTCTYQCKIDYPGSNAKQNCNAWTLNLLVCKLRTVACDCSCTCNLVGGIVPDPGDPLHYNYVHYDCPGFGGLGGRVPKSIPITPTITELCADIKAKFN